MGGLVLVRPWVAVAARGPAQMVHFQDDEIARYSRHILLPEVGGHGQQRLKQSSALVVGAGGLGAPVLIYLAAAGLGRLGVVDDDEVRYMRTGAPRSFTARPMSAG